MNLFVSYRRDDSEGFAGWLAELLRSADEGFEPDEVFVDVDDIDPGANFVRDMIAAVGQSDVVLVIIGRSWVRPSLQKNDDAVRLEIEAAMKNKIPIYCVMVDNAPPLQNNALPSSLRALTAMPRVALNKNTFPEDVLELRRKLAGEVRPKPRGKRARTGCLEVVHANPGFWTEGSSISIVLDGTSLGTLMANTPPLSFDIAPGKHRVHCCRGLRSSDEVAFDLPAGGKAGVEVKLALTGGLECQLAKVQ